MGEDTIRGAVQLGQMRDRITELEAAIKVLRQQIENRNRQIDQLSRQRDGYALGIDELRQQFDNLVSELHLKNGTIVRVSAHDPADVGGNGPPLGGGL